MAVPAACMVMEDGERDMPAPVPGACVTVKDTDSPVAFVRVTVTLRRPVPVFALHVMMSVDLPDGPVVRSKDSHDGDADAVSDHALELRTSTACEFPPGRKANEAESGVMLM